MLEALWVERAVKQRQETLAATTAFIVVGNPPTAYLGPRRYP